MIVTLTRGASRVVFTWSPEFKTCAWELVGTVIETVRAMVGARANEGCGFEGWTTSVRWEMTGLSSCPHPVHAETLADGRTAVVLDATFDAAVFDALARQMEAGTDRARDLAILGEVGSERFRQRDVVGGILGV